MRVYVYGERPIFISCKEIKSLLDDIDGSRTHGGNTPIFYFNINSKFSLQKNGDAFIKVQRHLMF